MLRTVLTSIITTALLVSTAAASYPATASPTGSASDLRPHSLSYTAELPETDSRAHVWGRDIFTPLVRGIESAPDLRLKAVFFNTDNPSAIINDRIVYAGSLVDGQKVVDIGRTHVILQGNIGTIRLEITGISEPGDIDK
jgi:hypothetical protein